MPRALNTCGTVRAGIFTSPHNDQLPHTESRSWLSRGAGSGLSPGSASRRHARRQVPRAAMTALDLAVRVAIASAVANRLRAKDESRERGLGRTPIPFAQRRPRTD